jgi:hypothetical protein
MIKVTETINQFNPRSTYGSLIYQYYKELENALTTHDGHKKNITPSLIEELRTVHTKFMNLQIEYFPEMSNSDEFKNLYINGRSIL